jgi:exoribonuclease-2
MNAFKTAAGTFDELLARRRYRAEKGKYKTIQKREKISVPKYDAGYVLEVIRRSRPVCAVMVSRSTGYRASGRAKAGRRFLDCKGKEWFLDPAKISDVSPLYIRPSLPKHQILSALCQIDREREKIRQDVDLQVLWEMVDETEQPPRMWPLAELSDIYFAQTPSANQQAGLFRALSEEGFFQRHQTGFSPHGRQLIDKQKEERRLAEAAEKLVTKAAEWLRATADGRSYCPPAEAERIQRLMADKVLFGDQAVESQLAQVIAQRANFRRPEAIFKTLVKLGYWSPDENLDLLRYQIAAIFSDIVLAESEASSWTASAKQSRRLWPLTGGWWQRVYALSNTFQPDICTQAVSLRSGLFGFTVAIHLSSPALMVSPGGSVQKAAMKRAIAFHLPDQSIPLLPDQLTARNALRWDRFQPCLTLQIKLSRRFEIRDYRFEIRQVRLTHALDSILNRREWMRLLAWTTDLQQGRIDSGGVVITTTEFKPKVTRCPKEGLQVNLERRDPKDPLAQIQRELSILANSLAADYSQTHGLPAVFRVDAPATERHPPTKEEDPLASYRQRQAMVGARLQTQPAPHHGLGLPAYVPITQPNHRFTDLVMQQQIVNHLFDGTYCYTESQLNDILQYTVTDREIGKKIMQNADRYWKLKYLEDRIDQSQTAVVLSELEDRYRVQLCETQLTALCTAPQRKKHQVGDEIRLRLVDVDARSNRLQLELSSLQMEPATLEQVHAVR